MKILERRVYRGPSQYAHFPVMRLTVDLGDLEAWPSAKLAGFNAGLREALPGLDQHTCSFGVAGGFIRRLTEDDGTWLGHVLEHVAIEVQQLAGAKVTFGKTRSAGPPGHYHVVYEYEEERVGEAAGELALALLHELLPAELRGSVRKRSARWSFGGELEELIRLRPAAPARAVDRLPGPRRRGPRHPVAAAQRLLAGPVRPRQVPEAHPGHGHQRDPPHRGRDRLGQGGDQPHPR